MFDQIEKLVQKQTALQKYLMLEYSPFEFEKMTLYEVQTHLNNKIREYEALVNSRTLQYNALKTEQLEMCKILGKEPQIRNNDCLPTAKEIEDLRLQIEAMENEKFKREEKFVTLKMEILEMVQELNVTPSLDFEKKLLATNDVTVMITDGNMKQLDMYHQQLVKQLENVKEEINDLRRAVENLWDKLEVPMMERDTVRTLNTGNSLDTLKSLKAELDRLNKLKMANIKNFVEKLRLELIDLWAKCHASEQDKNEFQYFNADLFTEDLLDLFELQVSKWRRFHEEHKELFQLIEEHDNLWSRMKSLEQKENDPSRYQNRGGQLLREEKERNRIAKRIPIVEENLLALAETFCNRHQRPFLVSGKTMNDYLNKLYEQHELNRKQQLSARKQQKEQLLKLTPGKSGGRNLFRTNSYQNLQGTPCSSAKRKIVTSGIRDQSKRPKITPASQFKGVSLKYTRRSKELYKERVQRRKRLSQKMTQEREQSAVSEYDDFEKEITTKENCRSSTIHQTKDEILALPLLKTPLGPIENRITCAPDAGAGRRTPRNPKM